MKVLIVSHEYPPVGGGGANACMKLSEEYVKLGHEVHIVTVWFEHPISNPAPNIHYVRSRRKHAEHCSFREMFSFLLKAFPIANRLEKAEHFDICLIFFGIPSGPVGYYLKRKYGLPYVIRFGGGDIPGFQKRFTYVYKLLAPGIRILWRSADALVANSAGLKNMAQGFYDKHEIRIITNGAETQIKSGEHKHAIGEERVRLLFVSRLIERKGLQDYLPYISVLRDRLRSIGKSVELQIVGDGPYRDTLEAMVKEYGISDVISFVGQKDKAELPFYYANSDIFIFTSHKEGMPNVILEAMSYGLPIITTPCEGTDELISGNGYCVGIKDFNECILALVSDPDKYEKASDNSLLLIRDSFSWSSVSKEYVDLFAEITGNDI